MLANNRLKLTAPSVHAFCISAGVDNPGPPAEKACPSARSLTGALGPFYGLTFSQNVITLWL